MPKCKVSTFCSGRKVDTGPLCATIFVSSGQSTALFSLLSSCFKMLSDRAKWNNDVHSQSHIGHSKCEHNTILCRCPVTGSWGPSVDSPIFNHLFFLFQALLLIGRWMEETAYYEPNRVIQQYKVVLLCLSSH